MIPIEKGRTLYNMSVLNFNAGCFKPLKKNVYLLENYDRHFDEGFFKHLYK